MSRPVTVLVLDAQPVSPIRKILDGSNWLVVTTSHLDLARHALTTMIVGVWICDLSAPSAALKSLIAIAEYTSPGIKILFMGPKLAATKANAFLSVGHGVGFLARPFSGMTLKKQVGDCVAAYLVDPNRKSKSGIRVDTSGKRILRVSSELETHATSAGGPDPEHYALSELLGVGGTGTVFLARDLLLDIDVAIKVINSEILSDPDILDSLRDEARIAMQLSHRNIVRVYNFSVYNDCYYIVMEFVPGQPLRDVIVEHGSLSVTTTCRILAACADGLEYAHANNVMHNDLKPENIFITDGGEVKLIDFGTATLKNRVKGLTHVVGTPEYISPEQLRCEISGPETDVYALGIITYLMLVGSFPFPADTTQEDFLVGVRPDFADLPESVAQVLSHATAFDVASRYASVAEFVADFVAVCGCQKVCADLGHPIEIVSATAAIGD